MVILALFSAVIGLFSTNNTCKVYINKIDKGFSSWRVAFASVVGETILTTAGIFANKICVNLRCEASASSACHYTQNENPIRKVNLSKSSIVVLPFSSNSDR